MSSWIWIDEEGDRTIKSYGPYKTKKEAKDLLLERGWKPGGSQRNGFVAKRQINSFSFTEMRAQIQNSPYTYSGEHLPKNDWDWNWEWPWERKKK
ncbi:MAG: hypothetical protein WC217_03485 [Candidatus Paceibacterota bacterium]|jgi:hypothetical protein